MMQAKWLCAIACFAFVAVAYANDRPVGLCNAGEMQFFSCRMRNDKWLALCGTAEGGVQYRFGKPTALELLFPTETKIEANVDFKFAHYFRAQVDRYEVSFRRAGVRYTIFDYFEEGTNAAGVQVELAGKPVRTLACVDHVVAHLDELADKLPCDSDNALNMGSCPNQ